KRKLAVAMAGAMVATAVVPAFAAEKTVVKQTISKGSAEATKLVNDLREKLANGTKFDATDANRGNEWVYGISAQVVAGDISDEELKGLFDEIGNTDDDNKKIIKNILVLEEKIAALKKGEKLLVSVVDKGHATVNGKVLSTEDGTTSGDFEQVLEARITVEYKSDENRVEEFKSEDLYDGEYITAKGLEFAHFFKDINKDAGFKKKGEYSVKIEANNTANVDDNKKEITFKTIVDYVDTNKKNEEVTISIKGKDLGDLKELSEVLNQSINVNSADGRVMKTRKIAGANRFETAVEIAKQRRSQGGEVSGTNSIVLVNSTSMIDGLTAAPYASSINADVLLTNADAIPEATMDYIEDLRKADQNRLEEITVIGGESVVSNAVVAKLNAKGIKVTRLGGADRHETSVLVAKQMIGIKELENAFVVAPTGEADAMGIAPVAVRKNAPIIVEGFNGLSNYSKTLLKGASIDVIGGGVTEQSKKELEKLAGDNADLEVIAGADRFETNAKLISKYFTEGIDTIYVAKDGYTEKNNQMLVDALAVGSLAGKDKAPVVLASEKLSTKQAEALKKNVKSEMAVADNKNYNESGSINQVGNGVNHSVMRSIAKLVGIIK
ncbi:MAG: cell wall-binding repeat-containing protein, partial [Terrisporobacter sp.]